MSRQPSPRYHHKQDRDSIIGRVSVNNGRSYVTYFLLFMSTKSFVVPLTKFRTSVLWKNFCSTAIVQNVQILKRESEIFSSG